MFLVKVAASIIDVVLVSCLYQEITRCLGYKSSVIIMYLVSIQSLVFAKGHDTFWVKVTLNDYCASPASSPAHMLG